MSVEALLIEFPWLFPSVNLKPPQYFHGFIKVLDIDHEVYLHTPNFPSAQGLILKSDLELFTLIEKCRLQFIQIEKEFCTVLEYLKKLRKICESRRAEGKGEKEPSIPQNTHFQSLLSHLDAVGWENVFEVSPDFTHIILKIGDVKGRMHTLKIKIPPCYPDESPILEADLPYDLKFLWNGMDGLSSIVSAWRNTLSSLQPFWDILDELDETALVLDPPNPCRRHTVRRLLLSNHVSVQLTVSVEHPSSFPQCQFLGSSSLTGPLSQRIAEKYQDWDPDRSIVNNLEFILGVSVVKHTDASDMGIGNWNNECAVCYSLHFENALPDVTCDHCTQSFHVQCLCEWLRGLPNSRQSMSYIYGECPYCTQFISCKV